MVPTARERKINTCAWLLHPNIKNQGKGMLEVPWLAVETNGTNWRVNSPSHFIFSLTLQQLFTSDFYPQAVNTQGKEAFAKELPMENKGMRFQKLFFLTFLWTYLPLRIYSLSFPLPRSLTICWKKLTRDPRIIEIKRRWKRKSSVDPKRKREQCL